MKSRVCAALLAATLSLSCGLPVTADDTIASQSTGSAEPLLHVDTSQAGFDSEMSAAHELYSDGKFEEAIGRYNRLVDGLNTPKTTNQLLQALQGLGDTYLRADKIAEARSVFERIRDIYQKDPSATAQQASNLRDLAAISFAEGNYKQVSALCLQALAMQKKLPDIDPLELSKTTTRAGYGYYKLADYKTAAYYLQEAIAYADKSKRDSISDNEYRRRVYLIAGGCFFHLRDYPQAAKIFDRLADLSEKMFGPKDVRTGWALLAASDSNQRAGHLKISEDQYRHAIWNFRYWNLERLARTYNMQDGAEYKRLSDMVFGAQVEPQWKTSVDDRQVKTDRELISTNLSHDPWEALRVQAPHAPGLVWLDPTKPRKGIIVCVHGLSLHHGSYEDFAKKIAPEGYNVVAFDVRGFGSYNQAFGAEEVDFDSCVQDLHSVIKVIRRDFPGVPIFLLGESMGGAISLRVAATEETLLEGLIASVPAGKRFQETGMKLQVAKKLLHKDRPFDIGTRVVRQATTDPELKSKWSDDPMVRLNMSPKELLRFQKLCKRNMDSAARIKNIPVVVFQGMNDHLIRPDGTLQIFHALSTRDKDMILLGDSEHLIFEEGQCPDDVLNTVVAWLNHRLTAKAAKKSHHVSAN